MDPTPTTYRELQRACDFFNQALFDGQLPPCLITLQREQRTYGYFSPKRFGNRAGQVTDEIAINPEYFAIVPLMEVLQTLGHELTHQWQSHFGDPGRGRYHNAEWADKMESIGLMPSSTGLPGGRRVGDRMADYVIPHGPFARAVEHLLDAEQFSITWFDRSPPPAPLYPVTGAAEELELADLSAQAFDLASHQGVHIEPRLPPGTALNRSNRVKYTCPGCKVNAWGKPALRLGCLDCNRPFEAEAQELADPARSRAPSRSLRQPRTKL